MRRPHADRLRARELRLAGHSVPGIARELGIARSTAYEWTKHLALAEDITIAVLRSRELYWQIAAVMAALTDPEAEPGAKWAGGAG